MVFDHLYKENSTGDLGILYQLKARLNRKDVHVEVNKSYHGSESFSNMVVDSYVVYAAISGFFRHGIPTCSTNSEHYTEQ